MTSGKVLCLLLASLAAVSSFESYYKFRINKDFIHNTFQKNMKLIFEQAETFQIKDVYLDDIQARMTNINLKIQPQNKNWENLKLEMMIDEGQILFEMHELEFSGNGIITDPKTNKQERIEYTAPISTCQLLLSLGEEYATWGSLYPRINVDQVIFQVQENLIVVSAFGDLPLYQSHQFELAVKKWFVNQLNKRQGDFKTQLQAVEKSIWSQVDFTVNFFPGVSLNTSLSESLKFQGDSIQASFINEFETGVDYSEFEKQLVSVKPTFSNENAFKKDIQVTVDENLVNHLLMGLFYSKKTFSLVELFLKYTPGNLNHIAKMATNFFTTTVLSVALPELAKEVGQNKKVDFRCGFSKQFLNDKVDDTHISQVWFKKGNTIEGAFHFGCGIFYNPKSSTNPLQFISSLRNGDLSGLSGDSSDGDEWLSWRSFFLNLRGDVTFDFQQNARYKGLLTGKIKNFNLKTNEIKVFKGDQEIRAEENIYQQRLQEFASTLNGIDVDKLFDRIPALKGIPIIAQSDSLKCMGLQPSNAMVEIEDRFMRIAYDFKVSPADKKCLFNIFEEEESKFSRWEKETNLKINRGMDYINSQRERLGNKANKVLYAKSILL
ncbi:UNKNOWN [Stylonychia lemnae]|uniref:Uncharacterized protein n=1 Tax=Stylonychia lemnae TaxID=5949 RepID=A0A078A3N9_STYLE|nr:UNKNOWN [Stylonychia lemnae]|eukprot:CDW76437.1 UNKNOWN [Stylonychia lemnae]